MSKYILWDSTCDYDFWLSRHVGLDWVNDCEVVPQLNMPEFIKTDTRKKIVLIYYVFSKLPPRFGTTVDYSWADLIICINTELVHESFETVYDNAVNTFNNSSIIFIVSGVTDNPEQMHDRFYFPYLGFFYRVATANNELEIDFESPRDYQFDALLGSKKSNRLFVFDQLRKCNLLDSSIVSLTDNPFNAEYNTEPSYESPILNLLEHEDILTFKNQAATVHDRHSCNLVKNRFFHNSNHNVPMSCLVPEQIYKNSWYSLITETNPDSSYFLTEKTAKPLFAKRIFVHFGNCGHLEFLRNQGFLTFDGIIDESYDNEKDPDKRWQQAWEQVLILSRADPVKIYKEANHILEYNFHKIKNLVNEHFPVLQQFIRTQLEKI